METVWQGGKRKGLKAAVSGKNSIVQQHLIVERLFEQQDHRLKAPQLPPALTLLIVFLLCFLRMWGRLCCPSDEVSHAALPQTQNRMGVELGNKADLQSGASL